MAASGEQDRRYGSCALPAGAGSPCCLHSPGCSSSPQESSPVQGWAPPRSAAGSRDLGSSLTPRVWDARGPRAIFVLVTQESRLHRKDSAAKGTGSSERPEARSWRPHPRQEALAPQSQRPRGWAQTGPAVSQRLYWPWLAGLRGVRICRERGSKAPRTWHSSIDRTAWQPSTEVTALVGDTERHPPRPVPLVGTQPEH